MITADQYDEGAMGRSISWFAVSGKQPQQVLDELGLDRTGEREEYPQSRFTCIALPESTWFIVAVTRYDFRLPKKAKALSAGCVVVVGEAEEHVMFSSATHYADGVETWHVQHSGEEGDVYNLTARGDLPPGFIEIHARQKKQQDDDGGNDTDVDHLFDVPPLLAKAVTSFRYDDDISGAASKPFEVLRLTGAVATARPWWKFW